MAITSPPGGFVTTPDTIDVSVTFASGDHHREPSTGGTASGKVAIVLTIDGVEVARLDEAPRSRDGAG